MTPIARGVLMAVAAATAFGATTPLVQALGRGSGPPAIAALLYGGAALFAALTRRRGAGPRLTRPWAPRIVAVGLAGSFVAPVALTAGLARTSGTAAALLLNLEAVFTVVLGALVHREPIGRRVGIAVAVLTLGAALVAFDHADDSGTSSGLGPALVALATLAWAVDNTWIRPLADLDPSDVVTAKGLVGALASTTLALATRSTWPDPAHALGIAVCGALGYGASLRLYLLAQRSLGTARTGSVFAVAPFLGVLGAAALGQPLGGALTAVGALAMAVGVWLHLGEDHAHDHTHPALTHDHPHRHDDGHHDHVHPEPVTGAHSHDHTHEERVHTHSHSEDLHHRHPH